MKIIHKLIYQFIVGTICTFGILLISPLFELLYSNNIIDHSTFSGSWFYMFLLAPFLSLTGIFIIDKLFNKKSKLSQIIFGILFGLVGTLIGFSFKTFSSISLFLVDYYFIYLIIFTVIVTAFCLLGYHINAFIKCITR